MMADVRGWRLTIARMARAALGAAALALALSAPASAAPLGRADADYQALADAAFSWTDMKDRATCKVDNAASRKKILALLVGVDKTIVPLPPTPESPDRTRTHEFPGVRNDINALKTLLARVYAGSDLTVSTFNNTTVGGLRQAILSALTAARCPDLVMFHYSGTASKDFGGDSGDALNLKQGLCAYYVMIGERRSRIDASPGERTELCDVAMRNAATAFRNRGVHFLATIDASFAELADFGRTERSRTIWRRSIDSKRAAPKVDAILHSTAAGFAAFYGASAFEHSIEERPMSSPVRGSGHLTSSIVQALGANVHASARDVVDYFGLRTGGGTGGATLIAEASSPDRPVLFPWIENAPAATAQLYKLEDYLDISGLDIRNGEAIAADEKGLLNARLKGGARQSVKTVLVDGEQAPIKPDGSFASGLQFKPGVNKVRITLITDRGEFIALSIDFFYAEGADFKPKGKQYALLIANQAYTGEGWLPLGTPIGDVERIEGILKNRYGMATEIVAADGRASSLILKNKSRGEILGAINRLIDLATEEDSILVFYAGHGQLDERTKKAYWVPVGAARDDYFNWVSSDDLKAAFEREDARARHILVLADSCYSGELFREETRQARVTPNFSVAAEKVAFFERLYDKRSRIAISSGASEPVLDGGGGGHSVFAAAFIKALTDNEKTAFTSADVYAAYLQPYVSSAARQTPTRNPFSMADSGGDFIFVRNSGE